MVRVFLCVFFGITYSELKVETIHYKKHYDLKIEIPVTFGRLKFNNQVFILCGEFNAKLLTPMILALYKLLKNEVISGMFSIYRKYIYITSFFNNLYILNIPLDIHNKNYFYTYILL